MRKWLLLVAIVAIVGTLCACDLSIQLQDPSASTPVETREDVPPEDTSEATQPVNTEKPSAEEEKACMQYVKLYREMKDSSGFGLDLPYCYQTLQSIKESVAKWGEKYYAKYFSGIEFWDCNKFLDDIIYVENVRLYDSSWPSDMQVCGYNKDGSLAWDLERDDPLTHLSWMSGKVYYEYDEQGNLSQIKDDSTNGGIVTVVYDDTGRVEKHCYESYDGQYKTNYEFVYNEKGQLYQIVWDDHEDERLNSTLTHFYNMEGQLIKKEGIYYSHMQLPSDWPYIDYTKRIVEYGYDALGRLETMVYYDQEWRHEYYPIENGTAVEAYKHKEIINKFRCIYDEKGNLIEKEADYGDVLYYAFGSDVGTPGNSGLAWKTTYTYTYGDYYAYEPVS